MLNPIIKWLTGPGDGKGTQAYNAEDWYANFWPYFKYTMWFRFGRMIGGIKKL